MSATIDITEAAALAVLRGFLLSLLPTGTEVVRGEQNQVPMPVGQNWVEILPMMRRRLGTNIESYDGAAGARYAMTSMELTVQADLFGPAAGDNSQIVKSMWRDRNATEYFGTFNGAPLFASDLRQTPFVNDQQQYEYRWSLDLVMQINPTITVVQEFAASLAIGLINVDAAFPPT